MVDFRGVALMDIVKMTFWRSLHDAGFSDEQINAAYAGFLPKGGEDAVFAAFESLKAQQLPFVGYVISRYVADDDFNRVGAIKEYMRLFKNCQTLTAYRKLTVRIIDARNAMENEAHPIVNISDAARAFWGKELVHG